MGYGFIGFKDTEAAKKTLKSIRNFVLDGHALGAEEPDSKSTDPTSTKSRTTKMIVKNVPFEATKDVRDLFGCVKNQFSLYRILLILES